MISSDPYGLDYSVVRQMFRERWTWRISYLAMVLLGAVLALLAWRRAAGPFPVAVALLLCLLAAWALHPLLAMHLTVFFTLIGDSVSAYWYPMAKNFSSRESILFIHDRLTFSPLDVTIGFAVACLLLRRIATGVPIVKGPLFWPLVVFTSFVMVGLVYGLAKGGDSRIAVFEVRPLLYLPMVYVLVSNLCRDTRHYRHLLWTAVAAVLVQSLISLSYYFDLSHAATADLESLGEHGSAIAMNSVFLLAIAWSALRRCSVAGRVVLTIICIPIVWVYFLSNRRAAVIGLIIGVAMFAVILFWRQKRTFWKFAPAATVLLTVYVGAFWNSTSGAGFPAQAVKSVIAPDAVSSRDESSSLYRVIENTDLHFTIRQNKIMGVGFGNPFYQPIRLPDISANFEFHNHIPHNSILWIWLQTGFAGFVAMFYVLGRSLMLGASRIRRLPDGPNVAAMTSATLFIVTFFVFAFVDIAWDARNMVMLGVSFAMCANFPTTRPPVVPGESSWREPAVAGVGSSR